MSQRLSVWIPAFALLAACGSDTPSGTGGGNSDVESVTLSATSLAFEALGISEQLTATLRDAGDVLVTGETVTWSNRVSGVTTVDQTGKVTATNNGVDTVVATVGNVSATVVVVVEQVPVSLDIGSAPAALNTIGQTVQLQAQLKDSNNRVLTGPTVTWSSADQFVVAVDDNGKATATGIGSGIISASSGALSDQVILAVAISGPVGQAVLGGTVACTGGSAGVFPCSGMDLVSYLPNGALGAGTGINLNDIWGWTDPMDDRNYLMVGRRDGVSFVDLFDPERPRYVGFLPITPGAIPNSWHDVKVYQNHAFIVADGAGAHGMQVFDLTKLRNSPPIPQSFTANTVYNSIRSAHNIAINEASGFAYITGASSGGTTCGGGLHMVNIQNPTSPTFAGCFAHAQTGRAGTGYTHDAQCVNYTGPDPDYAGKEICFNSNETHLSIADVTIKSTPVAISKTTYPLAAYTHQGWLSEDQRYLFVNDELDDGATATTRTLIWDVIDLDDPVLIDEFLGPTGAIDHNNYVVGNRLFASNYQFGIRVIDVADPANAVQLGFFDTAPQLANVAGFGGSWSNYPFFANGIIAVTSRAEGLFILRMQ